ncbi:sulfatase-like hydrolase/transferase [Paralimibaculum aggregatum]|uniref:Sulfatase-like hydrolase/transferase n=1 Tax=Paralimibaculum aggregatum TaxID=3036245 RepID=A0ABQ6LSH1_9RHOB|nr:sulfatase-like hydrolase/transferase [Limibaculum sp. NKW23]GMG85029.1 sulfatase-like hydrolase/transferase [Limibaculum sp. NKW23]
MKPKNVLILMSDEHTRGAAGCYGHDIVRTPNLDRLAARGARFDTAYTPCPVCVPARAAFATGKYIHQIGTWDNATAFDGSLPSWHRLLRERGHQTVSIGKLHFRSTEDDNGFADERLSMHIVEAKGDLLGLIRDEDTVKRGGSRKMAQMAGPGESMYTRYDRDITSDAITWLHEEAPKHRGKPWVMFVSWVAPHFPLTAPSQHFYHYYNQDLPEPKLYHLRDKPIHPYVDDYRGIFAYDEYFDTPDAVKRALAGYFGLVSFMDEQVGLVLDALGKAGLQDDTHVVYTSDHGDNLGARGAWGKSLMYEESVGVPLMVAGPGIPAGTVVKTPASILDLYPFIMEGVGARDSETVPDDVPGTSVRALIDGAEADRAAFSEYHGMGSRKAAFMIRKGDWKLVHYIDYPDQLFNLAEDPDEVNDRAEEPGCAAIREALMQELLKICDPAAVDREARAHQARKIVENGGKEPIIARGDLGFSVPPGVEPSFS